MVERNQFKYIKEIVNYLDELYPHNLAWDDDLPRIGFILGNQDNELENILLALDINLDVIEEAINKNVNLIITHHPLIFNPIYKIDYNSPLGKIIIKLIQNNISVYSMHTNLDVGVNGVADTLVTKLGLTNIQGENQKDAYMRFGEIDSISFKDILKVVKDNLNLTGLKYAGYENKLIRKIGIFGGSGGNEYAIKEALSHELDLYISSEFKLSAAQYAMNNNLCIIEINHGTEKLVFTNLENELNTKVTSKIFISEIETDPFEYYK